MKRIQRFVRALCVALTPVVLASTVLVSSAPLPTQASSHREAPLISTDPEADTTDVYAFIHPEHNDSLTIVGNWIPLEAPYGGPNFHKFSDRVQYELHLDNVGDAKSHIT